MVEGPRFEKEPEPNSPEIRRRVSRVIDMTINRRERVVDYKIVTAEGLVQEKKFGYMSDKEMDVFANEMGTWMSNGRGDRLEEIL